jgi:adenylate cyclase
MRKARGAAAAGPDATPFGLRILGRPEEPARISSLRVLVLLATLIVTANIVGVATVYVLAAYVVPGPTPPDAARVALENLGVGLAWTAVFTVAALTWGRRYVLENTAWLPAGRQPDEREQRAVLRLPLLLASFQAGYWLAAAALFAGFNAALGDHLAVQIGLTLTMGGLLTSVDCYLLAEIICRPLAARALAWGLPARLETPGVRARAVLSWLLSSALPLAGLMLLAAATLTRTGISSTRLAVTVLVIGAVILIFGFRITLVAARGSADPIEGLRRAMRRVELGDLDVDVPIYDGSEIGRLQAGFNRMAAGLRERDRIQSVFEHHVGEDVARTALAGDDVLGGDVCEVGVLFVDIVGSTELAAKLAPDEVVELLNAFFAVVVEVVAEHGGLVNKFEGDGALAVFGAPVPVADPAGAALAAGRELARTLEPNSDRFRVGIGVSAGAVVAGNIGAKARYEYTVIGDPVNEAARLTDLAKGSRSRVLASWSAVEAAGPEEARCWKRGREVGLRGRADRTRLATPI